MMFHVPGRTGNDLLIFISDVVAHTNSDEDVALYQKIIIEMTFGEAVSVLYDDIRCPGSITALGIAIHAVLKDLQSKGFERQRVIPMGIMTVQELLNLKTIITDRLDSRILYNELPEDESGPMPESLQGLLQAFMGRSGPSPGIGLN